MNDQEFVKPDIDALMEGAFARFSPEVRALLMSQGEYIKQTFGNAPYGGFSSLVMLMIVGDNSTSMKDWEVLTEKERSDGIVAKRLYQRLIEGLNVGVVDGLRKSTVARKIEVLIDLLNSNGSYISQVTGGDRHFEWTPVLGDPKYMIDDIGFIANGTRRDGGTPLRRRIVQSVASGLVRSYWLGQAPLNLQSTVKYLFITDGKSTESRDPSSGCILPHQVEQLFAELPPSHQPHFLGLDGDGSHDDRQIDFKEEALEMGFVADRIEALPRKGQELRHFLELWSQSQAENADVAPTDSREEVAHDDDDFLGTEDPFADDQLGLGDDFVSDDADGNSDEKSAFGDWLS